LGAEAVTGFLRHADSVLRRKVGNGKITGRNTNGAITDPLEYINH
jgi:hypothetical protein